MPASDADRFSVSNGRRAQGEKGRVRCELRTPRTRRWCVLWVLGVAGVVPAGCVAVLTLCGGAGAQFGGFGGDGNPFGVNFNFGDFPQRYGLRGHRGHCDAAA